MRILFLLLLFILTACFSRNVYMCGNRECIDRKEANEYFNKNLSIEVISKKKIADKKLDLIKVNTEFKSSNNQTKNLFSLKKKKSKKINKISDSKKDVVLKFRKIKNKKKKIKIKKVNKEDSIFRKLFKNDIKKNSLNKQVDTNKINSNCKVLEKCDINEISELIVKESKLKNYPNISSK